MLVGWLTLVLFPGFFQASAHAVGSGWRSLGLGVAVLAGVPVAMILIAITLVGLPVSLMLCAAYLAAIYLAKIWVGSIPGADASEASGGDEERLAAGTTGGPADPHRRWVHPVSWRAGPLGCGLPRFGSVCLAALSGFTAGNNGLKKAAEVGRGQARFDDGILEGTTHALCRKIAISRAVPSTSESR